MIFNVENWQAIVHKIVTSKNGNLVVNVGAVDDSSVLVSTEGGRTRHRIPKHIIEWYAGHGVTLTVPDSELAWFKSNQVKGFNDIKSLTWRFFCKNFSTKPFDVTQFLSRMIFRGQYLPRNFKLIFHENSFVSTDLW